MFRVVMFCPKLCVDKMADNTLVTTLTKWGNNSDKQALNIPTA